MIQHVARTNMTPKGYERIAVSGVESLTVPEGATMAAIQVETADVRWRDDGTNPTTSVGMLLPAISGTNGVDQVWEYWGDLSAIRFIEDSGSPTLNVSYYAHSGQ